MDAQTKVEIPLHIQGEPGEEQVRQLLQRASHVYLSRDGLRNWTASLVGKDGWVIERLFYQNPNPGDANGDEHGPIRICHQLHAYLPVDNEADMRLSPEWGSRAVALLQDIARSARNALKDELALRWNRAEGVAHCVLVSSSTLGRLRDLTTVARDDPAIIPILRDAWRETLP